MNNPDVVRGSRLSMHAWGGGVGDLQPQPLLRVALLSIVDSASKHNISVS